MNITKTFITSALCGILSLGPLAFAGNHPHVKKHAALSKPMAQRIININTASAEELTQLPHIGKKIAERIVSYRTKNGAFKSTSDLTKVRGISPKRLDSIKPVVQVK